MNMNIQTIKEKVGELAAKYNLPPVIIYLGAGLLVVIILATIAGAIKGPAATKHASGIAMDSSEKALGTKQDRDRLGQSADLQQAIRNAPTPNQDAGQAAPATATPELHAVLPALPAVPGLEQGAWQAEYSTGGTSIGTIILHNPTLSMTAAMPAQMGAFVTPGQSLTEHLQAYFQAPSDGAYLLIPNLQGKGDAQAEVSIDGRADTTSLKYAFNQYCQTCNPPVSAQIPVQLAVGLHKVDITLQVDATTKPTQAAALDLYVRAPGQPLPVALVPSWTSTQTAAQAAVNPPAAPVAVPVK
jgi:hypothetical protein